MATAAQVNQDPPVAMQFLPRFDFQKEPARRISQTNEPEWQVATPYPTSIYNCGFAQKGEEFYIISGITGNIYTSPVTAVRRYNVASNTWTSLADIPRGSVSPPVIYYEGKIYVGDTSGTWGDSNTLRIYDIETNTWSAGPPTPVSQNSGSAAAAFNGNIYFVGASTSIYNIASNTWSVGPPPPAFQTGWTPGYAQIGQYFYLVGGQGGCGLPGCANSDSTIRLDMVSNTWSVGPRATFRRANFPLVAVGKTLVAIGGDPNLGHELEASSEVYQLDTSTWPGEAWERSPPRFTRSARSVPSGVFYY